MSEKSLQVSVDPDLLAEGIAIVGMSARFPGASSVGEFWDNLRNGVESLERIPEERLLAAGVAPEVLKDPNYVPISGSLPDVEMFDAGYFGFSPKDAAITDPQHRHFLECSVEAFEDAGHSTRRFEGEIGVFAGCGMNSYFIHNLLTNPEMMRTVGSFLLRHTGNDRDFLPTTVSYKLDLRGPSMAIQTACSTSLVAIHTACQSLLAGECDMALAGGSTIIVPNGQGYYYRDNEPVSPDGHCRPFEADSAGTVLSSGTGVVVLRRLEDAISDGDCIHAVIRGSAVNNDGAGKIGYLAPSVEGHASAVAEALSVANISAESVSYVEAHGTGTRVGDPIEIAALTQAFRTSTDKKQFCRIGSVKSNIGHLDTAAGVASLIKVVKSLEESELAPTLHFKNPNPEIEFDSSPFIVNAARREWVTDGGPRRAGVSSLGIGGTNAHVILEETPELPGPDPSQRTRQTLVLSAKTRKALGNARSNLADWLRHNPDADLADVAFTLQEGRDYWEHRLVCSASDPLDAAEQLEEEQSSRVFTTKTEREVGKVAFMLSGAGGQYPNMGRGLYEEEPVFRAAMDDCLATLSDLIDFDLKNLLFPAEGEEERADHELRKPSRLCPAVVAVEWALVQLWRSWGVEPSVLIGHSLGEYVAACVSGVLSLPDMLRVVVLRGYLIEGLKGGAMISLPLSESEALEIIGDDVDLAAVNSPGLCVASGTQDAVATLSSRLEQLDIEARMIPVDAAGHSRHLDPILNRFLEGLKDIKFSPPAIPYISNVTGTWADAKEVTNPEYWVRHLRGTVRFAQGLQTLIEHESVSLVEVGPGQSLCAFARQQAHKPQGIIPSLRKVSDRIPDQEHSLTAFGKLWASGYDVQWSRLRGEEERRQRLRLPSYPFEHSPYWVEPGQLNTISEATAARYLSKLESLEDWVNVPVWRPAKLQSRSEVEQADNWLVFLDELGVGQNLAEELRASGHQVVTVQMADTFFRLGDTEFALSPERGIDGYEELIAVLRADELVPNQIVHLWSITADDSFRPGSSFLDRSQESGFYSLMFLMQALGESSDSISNITVVTNGLFAVDDDEKVLYPEKATVLGPVRVIPREYAVMCRCVDVSLDVSKPTGFRAWVGLGTSAVAEDQIREVANKLCREIISESDATMVALRADGRFEEQWAESQPKKAEGAGVGFRKGGVYLISGGLGGLGLAMAEQIGLEHQARLVLLNRSRFPAESEWDSWIASHAEQDRTARTIDTIRRIREAGGDVMVASCDITDLDAVRQTVSAAEQMFGPINGVLHAAASVSDGLIQTKTKEDAEVTFSAKLHGTRAIDEVLSDRELDFFVLFSSTSAVVGLPGQIDYAAANAYLNAFAEHRSRADRPVLAIDWGVWNGVGGADAIANQVRNIPETPSHLRPTHHPLLGDCIESGEMAWEWRANWSATDLWVLDEHRTGDGTALLPGTAYLEIGEAAFRDATGLASCRISDVVFLRPLVVADDQPVTVRVRLERKGRDFDLAILNERTGDEFATMSVRALDHSAEPLDVQAILDCVDDRSVAPDGGTLQSSQEAQLRFGPRWSVIREIGLSGHEGYARLNLEDRFHTDTANYRLHPGLLDIATSFGIPLVRGWSKGGATYVPLAYDSVEFHAALEPEIFAYVKNHEDNDFARETATFDITLARPNGEVLVDVRGYQMRKLANDLEFVAVPVSAEVSRREPSAIEKVFLEAFDNGIRLEEGMQILRSAVETGQKGALTACPINIEDWEQRIRNACDETEVAAGITFDRPDLDTEFEPPRNSLDEELVKIWQEFLGVGEVGIFDDFFDLGGHSLIAVRMFARIKTRWGVDWPISVLFDAPNVAGLSDALAAEVGAEDASSSEGSSSASDKRSLSSHRYLVSMNRVSAKADRPPFFIVAGMFGNVLNLRHLATHLGTDQPVYALQAKGLYGEDEPHQCFEDAAKDYIREIREVQPSGPYLLGGFSGGGVTAFEMAHQLLADGEEVSAVVMLDSIPPHPAWPEPNLLEKLQIKGQRMLRNPVLWIKTRLKWEMERRGYGLTDQREMTPAEFRSSQIEQAFRASLARYEMRKLPLKVSLFRPELDRAYELVSGRVANSDGQLMESENWWSPWVDGITVTIVTGNHDSMVLEPNVKKLAMHVRTNLDDAVELKQCMGARSVNGEANGMAKQEQGVPYAN